MIKLFTYLVFNLFLPKIKRSEPNKLQHFILSTSTGAEFNLVPNSIECNFRVHAYFKVLDVVIVNMEKRFSPESLKMATAVSN